MIFVVFVCLLLELCELLPAALTLVNVQSGASGQAKHGGAYFSAVYSLMHLVRPNAEELISQPFMGLLKIRWLLQDRMRS